MQRCPTHKLHRRYFARCRQVRFSSIWIRNFGDDFFPVIHSHHKRLIVLSVRTFFDVDNRFRTNRSRSNIGQLMSIVTHMSSWQFILFVYGKAPSREREIFFSVSCIFRTGGLLSERVWARRVCCYWSCRVSDDNFRCIPASCWSCDVKQWNEASKGHWCVVAFGTYQD